jgi:hypothetical protein
VTRDLGFGEMHSVRHGCGFILVRLPYHFTAEKIKRIMDAFLEKARDEELLNAITVVEVGRFRIRRLR